MGNTLERQCWSVVEKIAEYDFFTRLLIAVNSLTDSRWDSNILGVADLMGG